MNVAKLYNFDKLPDSAQLKLTEAAEVTATSVSTIRRLIKGGKLKAAKLSTRSVRVSAGDLRRFIRDGEVS